MAHNDGGAAKARVRSGRHAGATQTDEPEVVVLNFTLSKKVASRIGRIRRWEEQSKSKTLELTGRR